MPNLQARVKVNKLFKRNKEDEQICRNETTYLTSVPALRRSA